MENAKVLELLNQSLIAEYLQRLLAAKMKKLTLFPVFPITSAPNVSEPRHLAMIENPECLMVYAANELN